MMSIGRNGLVMLLLLALVMGQLAHLMFSGWPGLFGEIVAAGIAVFSTIMYGVNNQWNRTLWLFGTAVFFSVGFVLNALLLVFHWGATQFLLPEDYASIALSFQIGFVGWVAWTIGFLWYERIFLRTHSDSLSDSSNAVTFQATPLVGMAILGMLGRFVVGLFVHSQAGDVLFGRIGTVFSILGTFGLIAVCVLYHDGNRGVRRLALIILVLFSGAGILTGQRAGLIKGVLSFVLFVMVMRNRAGQSMRRVVLLLVGIIGVFILLYPMLTQYKTVMGKSRQLDSGQARVALLGEALTSASAGGEDSIQNGVQQFLLRLSQIQWGALLISDGKDTWGFLHGRSLQECLFMFIPRAIWPSKPVIGSLGTEGFALVYPGYPGSCTVPIATDWYLNFEWIGVVVGMFLTGILVAFVHCALSVGSSMRIAALSVMALDVCQAGVGLPQLLFPLVIIGSGCYFLEIILPKKATYDFKRERA